MLPGSGLEARGASAVRVPLVRGRPQFFLARDGSGSQTPAIVNRNRHPTKMNPGPARSTPRPYDRGMALEFRGEVIEWRGPSPFFFAVVPPDVAEVIADLAPVLTYGWGVIPARVTISSVTWTTSLFPKDGGYLVPLRAAERKRARAELGDSPVITLEFADP